MRDKHADDNNVLIDSLRMQYEVYYQGFVAAIKYYFTATAIVLAFTGASISYILRGDLSNLHSRLISSAVLVILLCWYFCGFWGLRFYSSIVFEFNSLSKALGIKYNKSIFLPFKIVIISALIALAPIVCIYIYFIIVPPIATK